MNTVMRDDEYNDPVKFGPTQLVSSSKLVRSLGSYIDQSKKRPIFITRDQEVEAVLISLDDYRELLEEEARMEDLYYSVYAVRRMIEFLNSDRSALNADEVLAKFNVSRKELVGVDAQGDLGS